jgi:hypothetical protein
VADFRGLGRRLLESHSYGFVLALIVLTFMWGISFPAQSWARVVLVALQSATLLTALWTSRARPRFQRWAWAGCSLAVVASLPAVASDTDLARTTAALMSLAVVAVTPVAILHSTRSFTTITARVIMAALCIYLLIGMSFAALYAVIDASATGPFFAQTDDATYSDYLYYSFITQTTVGFGDLTTISDVGRAFTTVEALMGQIYLVTVVAMIVANLGRPRHSAREEPEGKA